MSVAFNSSYRGLVQLYEREIGANPGDVSGNTTKLGQFTADVNQALDDFFALAIPASGRWQLDDSNQTDYPIITANLVSGQRDYPFTTDETGNLILDIYKVLVADSTGVFSELRPRDAQSEDATGFTDGQNLTGIPTEYDKTANGIFLNLIPSYSYTNGLKVYINREPSYFTTSDTTKKPGVPGLFHKYFYLKPALDYARRKNLKNFAKIQAEVLQMEGAGDIEGSIQAYFRMRSRDERRRITTGASDYLT